MRKILLLLVVSLVNCAGLSWADAGGGCQPGDPICELCKLDGLCGLGCNQGQQFCFTKQVDCLPPTYTHCVTMCFGSGSCGSQNGGLAESPVGNCRKGVTIGKMGEELYSLYPWLRYGEEQLNSEGNIGSIIAKEGNARFHQMLRIAVEQRQSGKLADSGFGNAFDADTKTHYMIEWEFDTNIRTTKINFYLEKGTPHEYKAFKALNPVPLETLEVTPTAWTWTAANGRIDSGRIR